MIASTILECFILNKQYMSFVSRRTRRQLMEPVLIEIETMKPSCKMIKW